MNLFKGLLFLHGHLTTVERTEATAREEYGARTAAAEIAPALGNRVLSRQWFGDGANDAQSLP
ncbi:hypothetical protein [Cognatiluteimonas profundi]|uniref:hypothetical protein n=1 Tax=Cognatiluteimonas profundi TaxID=2594501 RepID=UPI00131C087D|nr:hypothetical protein [Lysobacter profundi]